MRTIINVLAIALLTSFMSVAQVDYDNVVETEAVTVVSDISEEEPTEKEVAIKTIKEGKDIPIIDEFYTPTTEETIQMSDEDIELIALVTMAEAEGESELGKRLVIDTILNRVDSEHFPDTVSDVVYQPNQFSSMWNGRSDRCYVNDDICELVKEELESRENSDVVFFRTKKYSKYGEPVVQVDHHYFSKYE